MEEELNIIFEKLKAILKTYEPEFLPKTDKLGYYDLWSFAPLEIDGRKRKELFFAGIIIQSKYVGFYFMFTEDENTVQEAFGSELLSLLKGKSCFHIKDLNTELEMQIEKALKFGYDFYIKNGWISK